MKLKKHMYKNGEKVTESYMIRLVTLAAEEKHQKLDDCSTQTLEQKWVDLTFQQLLNKYNYM